MLVAEQFIQRLATEYGKHPVGTGGSGAWYPQACKLRLEHHLHSTYEKSIIIERTIQYMIKDRTESFDDYFLAERRIVVNYYMCGIG